jgi:hypothetical protein
MLMKLGIPERIVVVIDSLVHDGKKSTYIFLLKAMNILIAFGSGPPAIQENLCENGILPLLFDASKHFNVECLLGLCTFLHGMARNPSLLNHLENVGIIPLCSMLIKISLDFESKLAQVSFSLTLGPPQRRPPTLAYLLYIVSFTL